MSPYRYDVHLFNGFVLFASLGLGVAAGCGGPASSIAPEGSQSPQAARQLSSVSLGTTSPVFQQGQCYLAGQPQEADFATMKESGVTKVISVRDPQEVQWDEKAAAEAAGLEFVQVPIGAPDQMTDEKIAQVCSLLHEAAEQDQIVVLHCGVAVRAAAVWMAYHCVKEEASWEESEARVAGMLNLPDNWKIPVKRFVDSNSRAGDQN